MLALLVVVSLILLTAYFGESPGSPLHTVQRGIVEVFSPIQEGASKVLSPVRDVAGWFSGTFKAKSQRDQLKKQVQALTVKLDQAQQHAINDAQLSKEVGLDASLGISSYRPVGAQVIEHDPTLWYATIEVDKGSDDGVHTNDPVVGDGALVGVVSTVDSTFSIVKLITDNQYAVTAEVQNSLGDVGVLVPKVGSPNQLLLQSLPNHAQITAGEQVVTAGFKAGPLESHYPPGIPIGQVSNADQNNLINNGQVEVAPTADLRHLSAVQVLTSPHSGTQGAQVPGGTGAGAGAR